MTPERWRQTEELFHAARAAPPGERAAFLAAACPDDDALRRDVERLLAEPVSDDGFLAPPTVATMARMAAASAPPDMTGQTIGGYRLETLIGAGGMGEVYLARDASLGRDVAIKILPRAFTSHPDRLARFEREARMLGALNHPNICAIYGFEEAEASSESGQAAMRFLILELVEGETLADTLAHGSEREGAGLAPRDALTIARQIAEALEVAHDKGIIHRDLKPANIKITPDGVVKVLDFGLAKTVGADGSSPDLTQPADATAGGRREGVVMGTAAYMSPEQASGKAVDRRTDIWAFGVVVFEMVAGQRPFSGETRPETLAAILKSDPEWSHLPQGLPADLRRLLRRCLEKDPKRRLQSMGDARVQIDELLSGAPDAPVPLASTRSAWSRRRILGWGATGALGFVAGSLSAWRPRPASRPSLVRFPIALPPGQLLNGSGGAHMVALSPDGARIAYVTAPYGLHVRTLSESASTMVAGTENYEVREPVFSPDGSSIVFFSIADHKLKRIPMTGGAADNLCDAATPTGMSWSANDIVFGQGSRGIQRISTAGGAPETIVRVQDGESAHGPQLLPDGQHVLFTIASGTAPNRWDKATIVVESLRSGERKTLITGGSDARYLPSGHLVYALEGMLYAYAFDVNRRQLLGERVLVLDGVKRAAGNFTGTANYGVSDNGSLVYVSGPSSGIGSALLDFALWHRTTGMVEPFNLSPGMYALPRVSPNGERIAFGTDDGSAAIIWRYDTSRASSMMQVTQTGDNRFPVWASNTRVAYQSDIGGARAVFWQAIDGSPPERLTTPAPATSHAPESWSPDGETLLYSVTAGSEVSLWTYSVRSRSSAPFGRIRSSNPVGAVFSPNGRWVAYATTERDRTALYVRAFPDDGVAHPLAASVSDSPKQPRWSPDGTELFYNPRQSGFEVVRFNTQPAPGFGKPVPLKKVLQFGPPDSRTNYDVMPDGRLLGLVTAGQKEFVRGPADRIEVVLNWLDELQTKVPRQPR
jgi:serine/threonine-protein kinase